MKPFHAIAVPHKDILEGRLTMDVFAADLWEVAKGRGADEYKDPQTFFQKTYLTTGLDNLLAVVEKRLKGQGGDPVIQLQTPFGGGKTHALIAMYHRASSWSAKKVVIVGTALKAEDSLWSLLEKSLTGKPAKLTSQVSPGREAIQDLLRTNQPVLILMDELLEYITKAAGVKVGESTLAAQTIAFMQELSEAVSTLDKTCLVVTLPSSFIEHYDATAEKLFQQLQKVSGRIEKIYTPVQENEISRIIRCRLFSSIDDTGARKNVSEFIKYAEKQEILPSGVQPSEYRDRFIESYPFVPEVIDVLYHRWGSFPTFQRTRGVLRLLSLVVYSLKTSARPFITLADFDLANGELRMELIKHIGSEFNSIVAADITDVSSGSARVDVSLGKSFQGFRLGTRASSAIFLYSFSGGQEKGATLGEIKRNATTEGNPSPIVSEAVEQLKNKLFYLQSVNEKYFFNNQPNLNRILLTVMENIKDEKLVDYERDLLRNSLSRSGVKVIDWEENPADIADSEDIKLVVLKRDNKESMLNIIRNKGQTPRVFRNTLLFLYPLDSERSAFTEKIKRKLAYEQIETDRSLNLTAEQKNDIKNELKKAGADVKDAIRRLYRLISVPTKDGIRDLDLGIPTYGEGKAIDTEVIDKLRSDGEILAKIAPLVLKEKYLVANEYVSTEQIYQASLKTPGETRYMGRSVLELSISEGVVSGLFGLGEIESGKLVCRYFKEKPAVYFSGNEVLIRESLCVGQAAKPLETPVSVHETGSGVYTAPGEAGTSPAPPEEGSQTTMKKVTLKFAVPKGKVSNIMGVMNYLQSKFGKLEISISAESGEISTQEYEDKIKEAFNQLGINVDEQ
jgi:hypothetical protein